VEQLRLDVILITPIIITTGLVKITGITKGHTGRVSGSGKDSSISGSSSITIGIVPIIDMPGRLTGGNFYRHPKFLSPFGYHVNNKRGHFQPPFGFFIMINLTGGASPGPGRFFHSASL
jgi:hypothetical protein